MREDVECQEGDPGKSRAALFVYDTDPVVQKQVVAMTNMTGFFNFVV